MDHAITLGNVLTVLGVGFGICAVLAVCVFILVVTNPFRSGH